MQAPPTDAEVIEAFAVYIGQRSAAGVLMAKAVSDIAFRDGRVRITLDPARAGAEYWALMEVQPFDNPAYFYGTVVAFNDDEGTWLRRRVTDVDVVDVDGRPLGTATVAELYSRATG
ncbi:hypothetical protein [Gordonia sihwensis]|nr:hypothetical protein [Gordonia sihwensis]WFN94190.1 hypothetical protein P5P27_06485 [Gordonia sihwensis]WFN94251.1 hypothetical protein P5P27_06795 [Gordonia sihwensis]